MNEKRVVVTGIGPVTPLGTGKEVFFDALVAGENGIRKIDTFDVSEYTCQIGAIVENFIPTDFMDPKQAKRMDKFCQFAVAAARLAIEDSKLQITDDNASKIGAIVGCGIGGLGTLEQQHITLLERGPSRISPFLIPMMITNMAAGWVSIVFGAKGYNTCTVTACASATHSIGEAYEVIKRGQNDVMITGGTEAAITPLGLAGFCAAKSLSTRNDEPEKASRPFDAQRDGFVMGEGAGIIVIEELEHAKKRGAHIYAEVVGYGATSDAYHITAPAPSGQSPAEAMRQAISNVGVESVDYINAHGTSTKLNDEYETAAIKNVFGDNAYKIAVSSTKSMTGHLLGAAGGIEAIASVMAIENNIIPPTINYENKDEKCDLDYVPNQAREAEINVALSNSLGFGGHNAVLAFKRYGK